MEIPDNWLPTPTNINSLPDPIRKYIHQLQTRTDPAGDVRRIAELKDQVEAMSEMVERVARAIHLTADKPPSWLMGRALDDWSSLSPSEREQFRRCAREAIRAMREPTAAQMAEAMNIDGPVSRGQMTAIEVYQALIDAALDEKEGGE